MKNLQRIVLILFIILFLIFMRYVGSYVTVEQLQKNIIIFEQFVKEHYYITVFCYIALYIFAAACALPVAAVLTVAGGLLFGTFAGGFIALTAATIGAVISFLLIRHCIGKWFRKKYGPRLHHFDTHIKQYGFWYLFMVRVIPIFPYFAVNVLASFTSVSLRTFIAASFLGMIPASFAYASIGKQLGTVVQVHHFSSLQLLISVVILLLLGLGGYIFKKQGYIKK